MNANLSTLLSRRMLILLVMGYASGLPLLLIGSTLQAWMTDFKLDLSTLGLVALLGLPYTVKFLWAPWVDRYHPKTIGRRRFWALLSQGFLVLGIFALGWVGPVRLGMLAAICFFVAFWSATQDIVLDAYRREILDDKELGFGTALFVNGYRLGMLVSGALALFLADRLPWERVYIFMGLSMLPAIAATLLAEEPHVPEAIIPKSLEQAVVEPLREFFKRDRVLVILIFIFLYKLGDQMAGNMTTPFILKMGFTKTQFAALAKTLGTVSMLAGSLVAGICMLKVSMSRALLWFGILQGISTLAFAALVYSGPNPWVLGAVIVFEFASAGLGTTAFSAFLAKITDRRFTATQFALLSSLVGVPRVLFGSLSGYLALTLGWGGFFLVCALLAIPALFLIPRIDEKKHLITHDR